MKNILPIKILTIVLISSLLACYKEDNPNDGNFTTIGNVAQISSMSSPVTSAPADSVINLEIRMNFVNTTIKELKFYQRIGTTGSYVFTKSVPFVPNFVEAERIHVVSVPYTVPKEKGKTFSLQVEAISDKDLISRRRTLTPTNITVR